MVEVELPLETRTRTSTEKHRNTQKEVEIHSAVSLYVCTLGLGSITDLLVVHVAGAA